MSEAGRIRLLAIGLLGGFIVFGAALISLPLLIREPLPVVRPNSAISFALGEEQAVGRLQVDGAGVFVVDLAVAPGNGQVSELPQIALFHLQGARLVPATQAVATGHFRAAGRLEPPGQWRIELAGDPVLSFDFILAEF